MKLKKAYSIIIPAYNEEKAIYNVLDDLINKIEQGNNNYEIIVVDDGSNDSTFDICNKIRGIKLIRHDYNRGYGAAIKSGIKNGKYENIVIIDADGTYPNDKVLEMIQIYSTTGSDMVVGARIGKNAKIPIIRRPAKWFIGLIANILCGRKIPDLNSGLRIIKKEVIEKYIQILPDGFSFTTTITLAMLTNGYSVKYVPINYFKRKGNSKIKPIRDTLNFIQLIIRTILYFNPLKIFIPLSLFLVLIAFLVLIGSYYVLGKAMDVTFGVILMTAVHVLAIGILADLIDKKLKL